MRLEGYFNANDEPAIRLELIPGSIEVLIDTGFAGSLILPEHLAKGLTLHFDGFEEFFTVTGDVFVAPSYSMDLGWLGEQVRIPVAVSRDVKEALLGGEMLKNCVLTIDYEGRLVNIVRR